MNINEKIKSNFFLKRNYWLFLIVLLVSLLFIYFHVIIFVGLEHPVYYWDYVGYYNVWYNLSSIQSDSTALWFKLIIDSMKGNEYNLLPIAFLFPFYYLPLYTRTAYILAVSICYLIPVTLLLTLLFKRALSCQSPYLWLFFIFIFALTFTPFWSPSLRGNPDISGLIPIILVILFLLKNNLSNKITIRNVFILGFLLWLPFALRRWYAYTIVSLYLTLPVFSFFIHHQMNKASLKEVLTIGIQFLLSGFISLFLVIFLQKELIFKILNTDYSTIYSAYHFGFKETILKSIKLFGLYLFPFFMIGAVWSVFSKKNVAKCLGLLAATNLLISYIFFTRTQTPDLHHHLPFSLWFFILSALGIYITFNLIKSHKIKRYFLVLVSLLSAFIFVFTFYDFGQKNIFRGPVFPAKNYPLRLVNIYNYRELALDIEQWAKNGKKVSLIASGHIFNEGMILSINNNIMASYANNFYIPGYADLRDGIRINSMMTDYVIVSDPVQTHLPHGQNVITIPIQELLSGTSIGAAYKQLPNKYELDEGVEAIVFEKIRPFTQKEAQEFFGKFIAIYPDWEGIYMNPIVIAYTTSDISLGDGPYSTFEYYKDNYFIHAYPGKTKPVRVNWDFGSIQELIVDLPDSSCGITDGVLIQLSNEAGLQKNIEIDVMTEVSIDVSEFAHTKGTLIIANNGSDDCDSVFISAK